MTGTCDTFIKCSVFMSCNLRFVSPMSEILAVPSTSLKYNFGHLGTVEFVGKK